VAAVEVLRVLVEAQAELTKVAAGAVLGRLHQAVLAVREY
jgi:hypothetical protein